MPKKFYNVAQYESRRSVGYLMRRAAKLITGRIEALFIEEDISFVQWVIMMHLRDNLTQTAADLSQHLCHDSGALTRVLDQMEKRGMVARERSAEDRRRIGLTLTQEGRNITESYIPHLVGLYNGLLDDFTADEANQLINLLTRLIDKMAPSGVEEE